MSLLTHLYQQVSALIAQHANQSRPELVVAYSGGVDSHVLLHALVRLTTQQANQDLLLPDVRLSAIHIHHGLNRKATAWQQHCQRVCAELDVPFQTAQVSVQKKARHSLEAQARDARYAKLAELAPVSSFILLAQHQDDQLETVLLQLKRGAGPKGLSGMARIATDENSQGCRYFRPLLDISQQQIIDYAQQYDLEWQEDDSNQNTAFERNFLRRQILPLLRTRWPQIASCVARSAQLCAEQQSLLDEVSEQKLLSLGGSGHSLDIPMLCTYSEGWQRQLVRTWLTQQHIPSPSQAILEQLIKQFLRAKDDANPRIQWQNWQLRRFHQRLYLLPLSVDLAGTCIPLRAEQEIQLPQKLGRLRLFAADSSACHADHSLIFAATKGQLQIRFGGYGDKFKPVGSAHSKPLTQWFKQWHIPPWQRDKVAIILLGKQILGLVIDAKLLAGEPKLEQSCQSFTLAYFAE